jgi:hypothetical protein
MGIRVKQGDLISIKLRDDLYSISYAVENAIREYFDITSKDGNWDIDKPVKLKSLFKGYVVNSINIIAVKRIDPANFIFEKEPPAETLWVRPYVNLGAGFAFKGGDLISVKPGMGYASAPVVKGDLTLPKDKDTIEKYDLVNTWGPYEVQERLIRYFEKGINRDDLKYEIFPGLWNDREKLRPLTSRLPDPLR